MAGRPRCGASRRSTSHSRARCARSCWSATPAPRRSRGRAPSPPDLAARRAYTPPVTPRGTDWSLALLVALGVVTGTATWFAGAPGSAWVFGAHAVGGTALALVLVWKLRRVWRRIGPRSSLAALVLVGAVLASGYVWSNGGNLGFAGYNLLNWHVALGALLGVAVLAHAAVRAKL